MSTPLGRAATHGGLAEVKRHLPAATKAEAVAALFTAVIYEHHAIVSYLLDQGVDVNAQSEGPNSDGPTPLYYATTSGLKMTRLLLERGARASHVTHSNRDPISHYVGSFAPGHRQPPVDLELVQVLLDAGVDLHRPNAPDYLWLACWSGDPRVVTFFIEHGCDPNARKGKGDHDFLWKAVSHPSHSGPVLAALVKGGIDANARLTGVFDETLLMEVCQRGDLDSVRLLLERGADPNVRTKRGTAITRAQESGNPALIDLLLEAGASSLVSGPDAAELAHLDAAEKHARQQPDRPSRRSAWAEALFAAGFRAAAAREFEAAGGPTPITLENPAAHSWTFVPFGGALTDVTPRTSDGRFPGAKVTDGTLTVPLPIWLGPACTRCDANGEVECSTCNGTGSYSSMFSDDDVSCEPRALCYACYGLKFEVAGDAFSKGECKHASVVEEQAWPRERVKLMRCTACGLSGLKADHGRAHHVWVRWACAVCERLKCTCARP